MGDEEIIAYITDGYAESLRKFADRIESGEDIDNVVKDIRAIASIAQIAARYEFRTRQHTDKSQLS